MNNPEYNAEYNEPMPPTQTFGQEKNTQWVAPRSPMTSEDGLTAEFMERIWQQGVIGMKEFRTWLANNFVSFAAIRDPSVDALIDEVARRRFEQAHYREEKPPEAEDEYPDSM